MKRLCFGLVLAALCGSVAAAWERVGTSDDGMVVYADRATIRKSGDVVKMWVLLDYTTTQKDDSGKPYLSAKVLHDYDCKDERARTVYYSLHAGQMAAGARLYSEVRRDSAWQPSSRAVIGDTLWRFACDKK